jgi:uncharacterized membrane protein YoaK (UPF0700 family)
MSDTATPPPRTGWGTVLAFVAGYVDTLGFIALFGLFTAHVTGNFVLIGKELTGPGEGVLLKLLAFPAFIVAVVAARLLSRALARRGRSAVRPLLVVQALCLLAFMAAGLRALPIVTPDAPQVLLTGILGAVAMGVQNAQARLELGTLVPTTVMTGNVTQVVIDLVDIAFGHAGAETAAVKSRLKKMLPAVAGFGVGAIGGACAWHALSFPALLLPVALLLGLAARRA